MCGIVGVVGQIGWTQEKVFKQLLEIDSLRGRHSTGVVKVSTAGDVSIRKKAVDGVDFVKLESDFIDDGVDCLLIGHNRHATKGAVNDKNAHPFTHDHIHGVHNGTLTRQYNLKNSHQFPVDSDNIFYDISQCGVEETATKLHGAWTIAMYDEEIKRFQMFRNDERPMNFCFSPDYKTMYFASEAMMLEWVLSRNNVKHTEILCFKTGMLMTIDPKAAKLADNMELTELEYPKLGYFGGNKKQNPYQKKEKVLPFKKKDEKDTKEGEFLPAKKADDLAVSNNSVVCFDYYNLPMTKGEFIKTSLHQHGCSICGEKVDPSDPIVWISNEDGVCEHCIDSYNAVYGELK